MDYLKDLIGLIIKLRNTKNFEFQIYVSLTYIIRYNSTVFYHYFLKKAFNIYILIIIAENLDEIEFF